MDWKLRGLLFAMAMVLTGIANVFAFKVLGRMRSLGFSVGLWRWPRKDFQLYSRYWTIAPTKGWSRLPLVAALFAFALAVIFLFWCCLAVC
jgi:hypothetical protein